MSQAAAYAKAIAAIAPDREAWSVEDVPVKDFSWRVFRPVGRAVPPQGWKLHVSCTADEIEELVANVVPVLLADRASFKLPSHVGGLRRLNNGQGGQGQKGKIVTVYPQDDVHAARLLRALDEAWPVSKGPRVSGEARLRIDSPISARYGAFAAHFSEDEYGRPERMVTGEDGVAVADQRGVVTREPSLLDASLRVFSEELEFEKELVADGRRYLPLRLLRHGNKKVYTGVDVMSLAPVIIKAATRGTDGETQLRNEARFLAAITDRKAGLAPGFHGYVPGAPSVLVLEEVGGRTLGGAAPDAQLRALPELARQIAALHEIGIAHRDLKLENIVLDKERVRLIDFDAAAFIGEGNPPALGTLNHFGPEGNGATATAAYDVYSLGVCIAHVLLQWNPAMLPSDSASTGAAGRLEKLLRFRRVPEALIALVGECLATDPGSRPGADAVAGRLHRELAALDARDLTRFTPRIDGVDDSSLPALVVKAGQAARSYSEAKPARAGGWRNVHMTPDYVYEGVNLGAAGIILGLMSVDSATGQSEFAADVASGAAWLASRAPQTQSHGLFTGNAGVALALAVAGSRSNDSRLIAAARERMAAALAGATEIDLFSGRAGVLFAATVMARVLEDATLLEQATPIVEHFLATAEVEGGVLGWRSPGRLDDIREIFTGPAHGAAGIATALGLWSRATGERDVADFAANVLKSVWAGARTDDRTTLRRFVSKQSPDGFRRAWCHGAAGHLWSILVAFGDDPRFAAEIDEIVDLLTPPAPLGNPTYCHGFAGELELWRLVAQVPRHHVLALRKAEETAALLRLLASSRNGQVLWHSEEPVTFTPDLWVGSLGPASALALWQAGRGEALLSPEWLAALSHSS